MTACIVVMGILLVIVLLLLIPVGGEVEYAQTGVRLGLRLGPVRLPLYPSAKKKKPERKKETKASRPKKEPEQATSSEGHTPERGGSFALFRQLLPIFCEALGKLKRRLKISFVLRYTAGAADAASAAIQFGAVSAGVGGVQALLENNFRIQKREVLTEVDFDLQQPVIYFRASVGIRIGQVLYLAVRYGFACLRVYLAHRGRQGKEKRSAKENQKAV